MARATHLTISTADRIHLDARWHGNGYNEDDEDRGSEVRQEVQVSVTYALDSGDTNLVRLAEAKALEVKLAHEAVWNRIGAFSGSSQSGNSSGSAPGHCSGRHGVYENIGDEDGNDDPDDDPDDDPLAGLPHSGDDPFGGGPSAGGAARPHPAGLTGQDSPFPTSSVIPSHNGRSVLAGKPAEDTPNGPEPVTVTDPDVDPITGPQKILIRSRAKKAGLTPYALESLVYQQFRVWKVEKLTKEQAASVLDALERDLRERGLKGKEMTEKNRNGKEGVSHADNTHADDSGHAVTAGTA